MIERNVWRLLAGTFTLLLIAAAFTVAWVLLRPAGPAETALEQASLDRPLERLVFAGFEASGVSVEAAPATDARIVRELRWTGQRPHYTESWEGATLRISHSCGDLDEDLCSIGYRVRVPETVEVRVETSSGAVSVTAMAAAATVRTVSGAVELAGITGKLDVQTVSGEVTASGLAAKQVAVVATSGEIKLRFAAAPDELTVHTTSGDAVVRLPAGQRLPYRVDVRTVAGEQRVGVEHSQSATRFIDAESTSGDVTIGY